MRLDRESLLLQLDSDVGLFTDPKSFPFSPVGTGETDLLRLQAFLPSGRLQALLFFSLKLLPAVPEGGEEFPWWGDF